MERYTEINRKEPDMFLLRLRKKWLLYFLALVCASSGCLSTQQGCNVIHPAKSLPQTTPWDLADLSQPPNFEWLAREGHVWSLYYQGRPYQGKPTRIFAYYATPTTLTGQPAKDHSFPAVVLVHGGGGTAFKEWAELWARRGYAAIAMDLAGCGLERKRLPDGGPGQSDKEKFGAFDQAAENQWTYHAVSNAILAHSLLRSFKYLTCIVSGLDNRFKAAVPVYGCGFLHENSVWLDRFAQMTRQQKSKWVSLWDPSMYVGSAKMPVFFINGTNDFAYPLDSYAKTYGLVKNKRNFRITVNMPHGHQQGWEPKEIGLFVDQYLKGGLPLPTIMKPGLTERQVHARVKSKTHLISAQLHYTTGTVPINKLDWESMSARIEGKSIISPAPPDDATIWFLTISDNRQAIVSSELVFSTE
jgi:pimeloyl-ACP methyl ester carboxylesterase